ncbi:hypothetical protein [Nonomuraea jabiensis]|uniref:Uncharacterized protein n=1 Tax=Nonomuraea jabiensis TaxID=882448 RepID=A0A7W9LH93_9ACTN|nr:hypothetical protein [Nonomuraea jabiensis]MBB5783761.1 hypothetical protein [Nonomuraea jabiensis]
MTPAVVRTAKAGATLAVAATVNVATSLITDDLTAGWLAAGVTTRVETSTASPHHGPEPGPGISAPGRGALAAGGDIDQAHTEGREPGP